MNKKLLLAWVVGLLGGGILLGALTVRASSGFWENLSQVAGVQLAQNLSSQISPPSESVQNISQGLLGVNVYTSKSIAETSITSNTTTIASILNNSGASRVVRELDFFSIGGAGNTATTTITIGYSSSTTGIDTTLYSGTFATSTNQWFADATHTDTERLWTTGTYLNVVLGSPATTTNGMFVADYFKF